MSIQNVDVVDSVYQHHDSLNRIITSGPVTQFGSIYSVNIGSDIGLFPGGTKPYLNECLLINKRGSVAFSWNQFRNNW